MSKHTVHFVWDVDKVYWIVLWHKNDIRRPNCTKKYDITKYCWKIWLSSENDDSCIDIFQKFTSRIFAGNSCPTISISYLTCIFRKLKILSLASKSMERVYLTDTDSLSLVFYRIPFSDSSSCDCSSQTFTIENFKRSIQAHGTLYTTTIGLNSIVLLSGNVKFYYLDVNVW